MSKLQNIIIGSVVGAFSVVGVAGLYARVWESFQEEISVEGGKVRLVEDYGVINDMHWSRDGKRLYIFGEDSPIDFPIGKWDKDIKEKDLVDLKYRRSFPWFWQKQDQFDGCYISNDEYY